jgi:hypothetical protein
VSSSLAGKCQARLKMFRKENTLAYFPELKRRSEKKKVLRRRPTGVDDRGGKKRIPIFDEKEKDVSAGWRIGINSI